MRTKEEAIAAHARIIEAKNAELGKIKAELDHKEIKLENQQKTIRDCNYRVNKAQKETDRVMAEKRQLMTEVAQLRKESRDTQKRRLDRTNSPAAKRHSPVPTPTQSPMAKHFNTPRSSYIWHITTNPREDSKKLSSAQISLGENPKRVSSA